MNDYFVGKDMEKIHYQDKLNMIINQNGSVEEIHCTLPVVGEGNNRIVYDLGDKILKVAKSSIATLYNINEYKIWTQFGDKSNVLKVNEIFEIDPNGYWYVAEKIQIEFAAMKEVIKYIEWLDYSDNAGYDKNGKLTIVDAENVYLKDLEWLLEHGYI